MIIKMNGLPIPQHAPSIGEMAGHVDQFFGDAMSATPATDYAYHWVTGLVDDAVRPSVKIGEAMVWGVWKTADFAGYVVYEKMFPAILRGGGNALHDMVNETVKNCASAGGCF